MAIFGGVLLILEMLWGRASLIIFAVSFDGMPDFKGSLLALLDPENIGFIVAYLGVGAVFAGLIFAISVVSMPMILDRSVDAISAGLTSLRLVPDAARRDAGLGRADHAAGGAGDAARLPRPAGGRPGARPCVLARLSQRRRGDEFRHGLTLRVTRRLPAHRRRFQSPAA